MAQLLLAVVLVLVFFKGARAELLAIVGLAFLVGAARLPFWFSVVVAVGAGIASARDRHLARKVRNSA